MNRDERAKAATATRDALRSEGVTKRLADTAAREIDAGAAPIEARDTALLRATGLSRREAQQAAHAALIAEQDARWAATDR